MADAANLDEMARHSRETAFVRACLGDEKGAAYWRGRARGLELAALDLRAASAKPVTPPVSSDGYTSEQKSIERAWRAAGLPEWFLGNGGTNHNLYAFAEIIRLGSAPTPALNREEADRG